MSSSPLSLEERRRRRDQRMAVETANQIVQQAATRGRTVTLEWAAVAVLLAAGVGMVLGAWRRTEAPSMIGAACWGGLLLGGLICHAVLQPGQRQRLMMLGLALFAGLPLAAIPFRFFPPERTDLALLAVTGLGAALFGGAARLGWQLRDTAGQLGAAAAGTRAAVGRGASAFARWLHDAVLKWIAGLFLIVAGSALIYFSRQQHQPRLFWAGMAAIFLVGSTGLWMPGLYNRTRWYVGLRHCGQLAFWLSLLIVPFVEEGPAAGPTYDGRPSWRFAVMGAGLVVIGATWLLQRTSIFSHHSVPERKRSFETMVSIVVVVLGLAVLLLGVQLRQRSMRFVVDTSAISQTNIAGTLHFETVDQLQAIRIVQPLESVPIYLDQVDFQDGSSYLAIPLLYPGDQLHPDDHPLVQALRAAGKLNTQSQPEKRVERWSR